MKKTVLLGILLVTGFVVLAAQQWEEFDGFIIGEMYGEDKGSTMSVRHNDLGLVFSGSANEEGAGFVLESDNMGLDGKRRLKLEISGIESTDVFDRGKLLKLVLNADVAKTANNTGMNRADSEYINARNGEYIFNLVRPEDIVKINLVFYKCTVRNLSIRMFLE